MNCSAMRKEEHKIILNDLYESIIVRNGKRSNRLRVISGYASPIFLRRVKKDFPSLAIELFIGMSQEGISKNDHIEFKSICSEFRDISVFYQVEGMLTHRKLLEFSSDYSSKVYVGSSNFSENGFFKNNELMVNIHYDVSSIFESQYLRSLKCDDEKVEENIKFYLDTAFEEKSEILYNSKDTKNNLLEDIQNYIYMQAPNRNIIEKYNTFSLEVVLDEQQNPHWKKSGINAWTVGTTPHLLQTPKLFFDKIFPVRSKFKVVTSEFVFEAELKGDFHKELVFLNGNIYEYIRGKIGLQEKRPISREDLVKFGNTKLKFVKVDDYLFEMIFCK